MRPMPSSTPIRSQGLTTHARRPLRALSPTSVDLERQVRRALGADPRLCAARLDLERLPRAVAPPAILHHDLDQLHRRLPVDISTVAVNSPVAQALGSKPLKPEKSVNLSFGATANPFRGLTLTADYYSIKIKDRIVLTENLGAAGARHRGAERGGQGAILDANGFQSVGAARFFINGLDTTTHGVDVVATYRLQAGESRHLEPDRGL